MRLRKFNANRESKKLSNRQRREYQVKTRTMILSIGILICSIILCTYAAFSSTGKVDVVHSNVGNLVQTDYEVKIYIDGTITNTLPGKDDGYSVDYVSCTNGAKGYWNYTNWALMINDAEEPTVCSIYFTSFPGPELYQGLIPVAYDNNGHTVVADPNDYYDYDDHEWANAVLVGNSSEYFDSNGNLITSKIGQVIDNDILQYYVWIPRYKYELFNTVAGSTSDEQMINIEFENKSETKSDGDLNGEWLTHPAFTFGSTELNGFWVGKFETGHYDSQYIDQMTMNKLSCTDEHCSTSDGLLILPNKKCITRNNISNFFFASRSIENSSVFGLQSSQVDTHIFKNMEWGAVAYLTNSEYGVYENANTCHNSDNNKSVTINGSSVNRCEVWINNTHTGSGSTSDSGVARYGASITGCSAQNSISDAQQNNMTTCGGSQYEWNGSSNNGRSSSTGNLYGVYDLSGGGLEYVMGNQSSSTSEYIWYPKSSNFTSKPDDKYLDKYLATSNGSTDDEQRMDQTRGLLGDATREVLKKSNSYRAGWYGDYSWFLTDDRPWFSRGGYAHDLSDAGIFGYFRYSGAGDSLATFRVIITAEDE